MRFPSRTPYRDYPPIVAVLVLLYAQPALGCWNADYSATADSPAWWTLSDKITPEELRHQCLDTEEQQLRYLEAVQSGLAYDLPDMQLSELVFYVDGAATPELVPAWRAFVSFASAFDTWPDRSIEPQRRMLAARGLDDDSIEYVLWAAGWRNLRAKELEEEVGDDFTRLEELSAKAREAGRYAEFYAAATRRDAQALSAQTGAPAAEFERGLRARRRRHEEVYAVEAIVDLKEKLGDVGWEALRAFLLEQVAVTMQGVGFEAGVAR